MDEISEDDDDDDDEYEDWWSWSQSNSPVKIPRSSQIAQSNLPENQQQTTNIK